MSLRTWSLIVIDFACVVRIAMVVHDHQAELGSAIANWWLFLQSCPY